MVGWDKTDTGAPEFEEAFTLVEVQHNQSRQLMFWIDEETDKSLERLAEERGMKKATLVRKIVRDWLRDQERHAS